MSRRQLLGYGASIGAALTMPALAWSRTSFAAMGGKLRKYVEPVPVPGAGIVVASPSGPDTYSFTQRPIVRQLHPQLPPTPLWAYDDGSGLAGQAGSFGMVVVAQSGTPIHASFTHELPGIYPAWIPVDTRLTPLADQVRVMTHLHGGFVDAASDGNPAVTPNGFGPGQTQTVFYPNGVPATLLWFHDHGLGATRLNVFAGLAAGYLIRDEFDTGAEPNPIGIPGGAYEVPLVIQDRQFNPDGTLLYPTSNIPDVTWIGEYFGDVMLVNGKVWPFLEVEPRLYRFRILNGCNARILELDLGGTPLWQIGAEGGLWDRPVPMRRLVLAPAERADVIVDFRLLAGQTLVLKNFRPSSPVVTPAPALLQVMQIRVGATVSQPGPTSVPTSLPGHAANLPSPVRTRFITLNEVGIDTAGWFLNLNGVRFGEPGAALLPAAGTVEDWVYVNLTGDTHPMHTHLFMHQVIGRTPFDVEAYLAANPGGPDGVPGGIDPTPFATGPMLPPEPEERGFKDTVKANPRFFTTIRGRFDLPTGVVAPQTYVHHCHIVEHEDNDMMQAFTVLP
ncbi:MAG: multicopper oxidase family protein [Micromonosporaceae bacterium]